MDLQRSASEPPILNPFTPMAFLPPDVAYQVTVTKYVLVASLGVSWLLL